MVREALVFGVLDAILGLDPIDWEERLVTPDLRNGALHEPLPSDPRAAPSINSLIGKYSAKGYDSITIMAYGDPSDHSLTSHLPNGTERAEYLQVMNAAMTTQAGVSKPTLIAPLGSFFGPVLIFSHFNGSLFNTTRLSVMKSTQGELTADGFQDGTAVFVQGKGMGMFENFWGGSYGKRAVEHHVEEEAEVWFERDE